jgi:hypothetical protein
VAGHDELVTRSGHGDVAETALLLQLVDLARLDVVAKPLAADLADAWQVGVVAAERGGQLRGRRGPPSAAQAGGEHLGAHAGQEHDVPLQALGAVDGEQLDGVRLTRDGERESLAVLLLGGEVSEQSGQRRVSVDTGERRHRIEERRDVVAPGPRHGRRRRGELDVETGHVDDPSDQVEQGLADVTPQRPQLAPERLEALSCVGGVVRRARVLERLHERHDVGGIGVLDGFLELAGDVVDGRIRDPGQPARTVTEQGEVTRSDRPTRTGEQGEQ